MGQEHIQTAKDEGSRQASVMSEEVEANKHLTSKFPEVIQEAHEEEEDRLDTKIEQEFKNKGSEIIR